MGHEVAHVIDYQDFGTSTFLTNYFMVEAIPNLLKNGSQDEAYQNISFEKRGAAWEDLISTFLGENKDIASKLATGEALSTGDRNKIGDFLIRQFSEGKLKLGYQLINGEVVRIQLYPPQ